ncbi:PucR family transcriptional regulator [Nocardia xishanensis]|uniref:PucR family transcriptional regulator n=1 Tax=Nocardia xishanensis TaxID=238964 RepID=UPI0008298CA9|nr:helix-turn-helix domain-containing protein [Nocardia xishanensis]
MSTSTLGWEPPSAHVSGLITATVEGFVANLDGLVDEMAAAAIAAAPALAGDAALEESVRASVRAMTLRWVDAQRRRPGGRVPVDVPPAALDVARDLIRHGVDFQQLLTGYRCAENVGCRRWVLAAAQAVPPQEVAVVADFGLRSINDWVDAALALINRQIERERDDLMGGVLTRRLETVTLIIDGAPIREEVARERLAYDLSAWHTGMVLWSASPDHEQGLLEKTARSIAMEAGLRPPLILPATTATTWVWLSGDQRLDVRLLREVMAKAPEGVLATAGSSRERMAGFRRTHREAVAARRVAERNPGRERFTAYDDVRIAVLASQDEETAGQFVSDTLGELAGADADLRETLRVYLQEDGNTARTAARLFTHRNTVLNRLERAERLLPQPLSGRRLSVGLALELVHWSGGWR